MYGAVKTCYNLKNCFLCTVFAQEKQIKMTVNFRRFMNEWISMLFTGMVGIFIMYKSAGEFA